MSNIIKACRKVVITGGVAVGKTSITKQGILVLEITNNNLFN